MPTPAFTIPVASPVGAIATPEIGLPCGKKIPSIPLIPDFSFTITVPPFSIPFTKKTKKGAKPTRKKAKNGGTGETIAQKIARFSNLCTAFQPKRPAIVAAPPPVTP